MKPRLTAAAIVLLIVAALAFGGYGQSTTTTDPAASASGFAAIESTFFASFRDAFSEVSQDHATIGTQGTALAAAQASLATATSSIAALQTKANSQATSVSALQTQMGQFSAGNCTLAAGSCSHTFLAGYGEQPVCFAAGMAVTNNALIAVAGRAAGVTTGLFTQVTVTSSLSTDTEQASWHCEPARN